MLLLLLLQTASPLAARVDTIRPVHDALHYDITVVPSDTGNHVLAEVQTTWRLRSAEPVEMERDSAMRVVRVLVHFHTTHSQAEVTPVYLDGAESLRDDL